MKNSESLGVPIPNSKSYVVRNLISSTVEERTHVLEETEFNMFSFPAALIRLDFLSDSGSTSMTDLQWAAMMHGDESYGRNSGYYCLLDSIRDAFERGDQPKKTYNIILTGETIAKRIIDELILPSYEGGFVNGGIHQLTRPNAFICPQGRAAEHLLFSTLADVLNERDPSKKYYIPNNGHFDTTGANIRVNNMEPLNVFNKNLVLEPFPIEKMATINPFKGNMDTEKLIKIIEEKGTDSIPLIYLTITNNSVAGQPVSMANIKAVAEIAENYNLPLFFDACRFAENAMFIKMYENGYANRSVREIVQEIFSFVDGFTISFKKDGLANMGGGLFLKDEGRFVQQFSKPDQHIGIRLKERQIVTFGNDSYGGLSGRDIMALTIGLQEVLNEDYLRNRIKQTQYFAKKLAENGVPVVLPAGGHAVYIDVNRFFEGTDMRIDDFGGVGLTIELIKHYAIRGCELGPFAFEWDQRTEEQRNGILNLVRFAIPRNSYSNSDLDYAIAAITELYRNKEQIPKVVIARGGNLNLRHFQTGLKPIYK